MPLSALAANDAFLVPTTVTYAALQREGVAGGMPAELVAKVGEAVNKVKQVWLVPAGAATAWQFVPLMGSIVTALPK